jgi:hypothetical protein
MKDLEKTIWLGRECAMNTAADMPRGAAAEQTRNTHASERQIIALARAIFRAKVFQPI